MPLDNIMTNKDATCLVFPSPQPQAAGLYKYFTISALNNKHSLHSSSILCAFNHRKREQMNSLEIVKLIFVLLMLLPLVALSRGDQVRVNEHQKHHKLRFQTLKIRLRCFSGRLMAVSVRRPNTGNRFKQRR